MASTYGKIPPSLIDNTTIYNKHTAYTHLFCILLRIFIGLYLIQGKISPQMIMLLCIIVILIFGFKFSRQTPIWKNYLRTLLVYSTVFFLQYKKIDNKNSISGILIIVEALLAQQSRYITTNMSRIAPN